ncbi:hypothetical protein ACROYT_G005935 [Oculina patagonica]
MLHLTTAAVFTTLVLSATLALSADDDEDIEESDPMMFELYDHQMQETFGELNLGKEYYEGDVVLTKEQGNTIQKFWQDGNLQGRDLAPTGFRRLWPNNTVPYTIATRMREESLLNIRAAIKEWQDKLCIIFKERQYEEDYIEFAYEGGCSSSIGRIGGRQVISVGSIGTQYTDTSCRSPTPYGSNVTITCSKGSILHEIGHALGFHHEHNRPDRDQYLTVVWKNVMPGCRVHFRKESFMTIGSLEVQYDYNSVMHYGSFFFTQERGAKTLRTKTKGVLIGQRERLSVLDVQKGLLLYQCDKDNGSKTEEPK